MNEVVANDKLGAFCRHTHVAVKGAGAGPLAGLTFGLKDIYDIAGHRTGFGSPDWLATHEAAAKTSPTAERLLDAGADMVGKTHTDELTYSLSGENVHYGTPVNVNAPGRIPGGSSSGSVRAPASFCGIYGIRPTHGRVSLEGACPLAPSFDTAGWFARSAELLERVGSVLLGEDAPAPPGRLLIASDAFALAGDAVAQALKPAVDRMSSLLGQPQAVTVSEEGLPQWFEVFRTLQGAEVWTQHGAWVTRVKPELGPGVKQRMQWAATIDAREVGPAKIRRENIARHMNELLADNAVLVLPTLPGIAPLRNTPPAEIDDFRSRAMSLLCVAGLARLPQVNLPLARLEGCPVGLSLVAARGGDMMLLALAKALI